MAKITINVDGAGKGNGRKILTALLTIFLKRCGFLNVIVTKNGEGVDGKIKRLEHQFNKILKGMDFQYIKDFNQSDSVIEIETSGNDNETGRHLNGMFIAGRWDAECNLIESDISIFEWKTITELTTEMDIFSETTKDIFPLATAFLVSKTGRTSVNDINNWKSGDYIAYISGKWKRIKREDCFIKSNIRREQYTTPARL